DAIAVGHVVRDRDRATAHREPREIEAAFARIAEELRHHEIVEAREACAREDAPRTARIARPALAVERDEDAAPFVQILPVARALKEVALGRAPRLELAERSRDE